ncbi:MAG: hemolysin family protein [Rikenellaceae bacterium]
MELFTINIVTFLLSFFVIALILFVHFTFKHSHRVKIEIERKNSPIFDKAYKIVVENYYRFRIFTSTCYILAIMGFALSVEWGREPNIYLSAAFYSLVLLFTVGIIPQIAVKNGNDKILKLSLYLAFVLYIICYPITIVLYAVSNFIVKLFKIEVQSHASPLFSTTDLTTLLSEATGEDGDESADEKDVEILENALQLSDIKVRDCMVPPSDIEAVEVNESYEDLKERFVMSNFSKLPVYRESIYNIIGYINVKQLFDSSASVSEMMCDIILVPESMNAQKLLTLFTHNRKSIAAVINEFGESIGIITLEDVLEEIFGDIEDEYDDTDIIEYSVSKNEIIISAKATVEHINSTYGAEIPENEDYDTIAGYIIDTTHSIPSRGEIVVLETMKVKIIKRNDKRIDLVKMILNEKLGVADKK